MLNTTIPVVPDLIKPAADLVVGTGSIGQLRAAGQKFAVVCGIFATGAGVYYGGKALSERISSKVNYISATHADGRQAVGFHTKCPRGTPFTVLAMYFPQTGEVQMLIGRGKLTKSQIFSYDTRYSLLSLMIPGPNDEARVTKQAVDTVYGRDAKLERCDTVQVPWFGNYGNGSLCLERTAESTHLILCSYDLMGMIREPGNAMRRMENDPDTFTHVIVNVGPFWEVP